MNAYKTKKNVRLGFSFVRKTWGSKGKEDETLSASGIFNSDITEMANDRNTFNVMY